MNQTNPVVLADDIPFADNPDPRVALTLVLDTSGSMKNASIDALNAGIECLAKSLKTDLLARRRVEIAIITFGGHVELKQPFTNASEFQPEKLNAYANTPMGEALEKAMAVLTMQKSLYKQHGVPYYRPWMMLISDGKPSDSIEQAKQQIHQEIKDKHFAFFAVGVKNADMHLLSSLSPRPALKLKGLNFEALFEWLSASMSTVSTSLPSDVITLPVQNWTEL